MLLMEIPNDLSGEDWKKFKKVILVASIDGYKDINEYIRFPSKWSAIEKNINK